jgi:hypothetical protein
MITPPDSMIRPDEDAAAVPVEWLIERMRVVRDAMLADTDWTQVADAPVDAAKWAKYRKALRDLPANTDNPANPKWPTPPT